MSNTYNNTYPITLDEVTIIREETPSQTEVFGKTIVFRLVFKDLLQPEVYASFSDAMWAANRSERVR